MNPWVIALVVAGFSLQKASNFISKLNIRAYNAVGG